MTLRLRRSLLLLAAAVLAAAFIAPSVALAADALSWNLTFAGPANLPNGEAEPTPVAGAFNAVSFADASHGWAVGVREDNPSVLAPKNSLVAFTSDGGSTWTSGTVPGVSAELNGVAATSATNVWAVGAGGRIAHWNGIGWSVQTVAGWPTTRALQAIAFVDASNGWAVGDGLGVVKTTNGGATWSMTTTPTASQAAAYRAIAAISATSVLAVGDAGWSRKLNAAGAPGAARTIAGVNLSGVAFTDELRGWAVGDNATCLSTVDGGTTWTAVQMPLPAAPPGVPPFMAADLDMRSIAFADPDNGIAVGTYQVVWRTSDGGATWQAEQLQDPGTLGDYDLRAAAFPGGSADDPVAVGRTARSSLASSDDKARAYRGAWSGRTPPPPVAPSAPSGVTLSDGGAPGPAITVAWTDASTDEDGFVIQRASGSADGAFANVASVGPGVTTWTDTGVDWGSTWYYRVRSFRGTLSSAWAVSPGYRVDATAPVTVCDALGSYVGSATIHLSASDASGSGVRDTYWIVDNGNGTPQAGMTVSVTGVGSHHLEFWSVDLAGNEEAHQTRDFSIAAPGIVDTIAPTTSSDAATVYAGPARITLSAVDNAGGSGVASTLWKLDGGAEESGSIVEASAVGTHTLEFWSVDAKGNEETPHHAVSFLVDGIAPTTTSDAKATYVSSATIKLRAADNAGGSGVARTYYQLDGGVRTAGSTVVVTKTGSHRLEFWSVDVAGTAEAAHRVDFSIALPSATVMTPRAPSTARHGVSFTVYGYLKPRHSSGSYAITLYCYRYQSGSYVLRKTVKAKVANYSSYSKYSVKTSLPYTGKWRIRAYHGDSGHSASWSGYDYVSVR